MSTMAQWGRIAFKVSSESVFTFRNMKRSYSARWEEHALIGRQPRMEFKGPSADEITITVTLDAECGVKPRVSLKLFREAAKLGEVDYFYVGGKRVGWNKFCIVSGTEIWEEIWNKGELKRATAEITFKEYM